MENVTDVYKDFLEKFEYGEIKPTSMAQIDILRDLIVRANQGKQITNMEIMTNLGVALPLLEDYRIYNWVINGLKKGKVPCIKSQ